MSFCEIVEQKMRMIRIKLTSQQVALLAGILALPSAMNGAIFYHYDLDPRNGSHSDSIDSGGEEDVYRITVTGSGTFDGSQHREHGRLRLFVEQFG